MKQRILFVFKAPLLNCPRPRRLLMELEKHHDCYYICPPAMDEQSDSRRFGFLRKAVQSKFLRWLNRFSVAIGLSSVGEMLEVSKYVIPQVEDGEFDYIFIHDLYLLPKFSDFRNSKVVFDAREFYPSEFADDARWQDTYGKLARYCCQKHFKRVYKVLTVSPSIVNLYQDLTGRVILLFPSYPREELCMAGQGTPERGKQLRFIHHGNAFENRGLEKMIELMRILGPQYTLDMMLVAKPGNRYYQHLCQLARSLENVSIIEPVHPDEITRVCSSYDMGLYLMEVNNSQNRYCLPNKFFEFLFAGLPVVTSFSLDMKYYIEEYSLGLGFEDEPVEQIAGKIASLSDQDLQRFREAVCRHVKLWTVRENVRRTLPELLTQGMQ